MTVEINHFGSYWEARINDMNLLAFDFQSLLRQLKTIYNLDINLLTFNKN